MFGWVDEMRQQQIWILPNMLLLMVTTILLVIINLFWSRKTRLLLSKYSDSRIAFGLYTDEACQNVATDIDGNTVGNKAKLLIRMVKVNLLKFLKKHNIWKETVGNCLLEMVLIVLIMVKRFIKLKLKMKIKL